MLCSSALLRLHGAVQSEAKPKLDPVELIRDHWGIPHIFSASDEGAMRGLGFATAEERGFQMTYSLRIIQGRLAEVIGDQPSLNRKEGAIEHDRKMRTFGWARAAERTAANLDQETLGLLKAYCDGVNQSFEQQFANGTLHPLFKKYSVKPEPWKPAHCLLSWWHLAQFFATDGTRDLLSWRNQDRPDRNQRIAPGPNPLWFDDPASVVQRSDVSDAWLEQVQVFSAKMGFSSQTRGVPNDGPKFSHAWVVGSSKSTTGSAVLVSDPQTPVRNPALWMEFHVSGKTFNVRGIGVPGSPGLLIGFNSRVAWGLTALGADQADLFRLETDANHPNQYRWDGQWRPMEVRAETIRVLNGKDVNITIRETHLGPVISEFAFPAAGDPEVALKRVPACESGRETIQGVFGMIRAQNSQEFRQALGGWRFPSANCVYGDADGHIGYSVIGAIPIRSPRASDRQGNTATSGNGDAFDWIGFVPCELLPQVTDPQAGFLLSANHRPVADFYSIPLGISTGSMGDTIRSWRLRECLSQNGKVRPKDVLLMHYDTVNPARREMVRLALHLRKTQPDGFSQDSRNALNVLEPWLKSGASSDLRSMGADLATRISTFFRIVATPLAAKYGGGESGLARFLKDAQARVAADSNAMFSREELQFIDGILSAAWREQPGNSERKPGRLSPTQVSKPRTLCWFESLDGFGSLEVSENLSTPELHCIDGQTIHSQASQSYTQWVPLHDPDAAQTICPIGHSDRPGSPFRTSTLKLWSDAKLHPAPLSRTAVNKIAIQHLTLPPCAPE